MYKITKPKTKVYLKPCKNYINEYNIYVCDNTILEFPSYTEFLEYTSINTILESIGDEDYIMYPIKVYNVYNWDMPKEYIRWRNRTRYMLYTHSGEVVKREKMIQDKRYLINLEFERMRNSFPVFRKDPVPRTGHSGGWGRYFRRITTTQEKREWEKLKYTEKELGCKICSRSARSKSELPESWDDIPRSTHKLRTWKRYRKAQCKY